MISAGLSEVSPDTEDGPVGFTAGRAAKVFIFIFILKSVVRLAAANLPLAVVKRRRSAFFFFNFFARLSFNKLFSFAAFEPVSADRFRASSPDFLRDSSSALEFPF
jgi:hypothetical protein